VKTITRIIAAHPNVKRKMRYSQRCRFFHARSNHTVGHA
jgi:hypothetical protein